MVSSRTIQEVFTICQPEKMLISSRQGLVPWLYGVLKKHPHREQKNHGSQAVA